jgi:hypothetical protein
MTASTLRVILLWVLVFLYLYGVTHAIQELQDRFVQRPLGVQLEEVKEGYEGSFGFTNIIGAGDGALFWLVKAPEIESVFYYYCRRVTDVK